MIFITQQGVVMTNGKHHVVSFHFKFLSFYLFYPSQMTNFAIIHRI